MRFSAAAILAMAMSAFAQTPDFDPIYTPESGAVVKAGSTFEITWKAPAKYAEGTVSISLIGGATQNTQVPLEDIASGVPNAANKYTWTVGANLGDKAVYGLIVRYESSPEIFQYSNPFHIEKAAAPVSSTAYPVPASSSAYVAPTDGADVTVTTKVGAVTVTLSSCTTSTTAAASSVYVPPPVLNTTSAVVVPSSSVVVVVPTTSAPVYTLPSAPVHVNSTFTTVKPVVPSTSVVVVTPVPSASTVPPPSSGAGRASAAVAMVGAIAMAMLAL